MKNLFLTGLAVSALLANSAFADNLGVLPDTQKPQKLVPASEFLKLLNSETAHSRTSRLGEDTSDMGYDTGYNDQNSDQGYTDAGYTDTSDQDTYDVNSINTDPQDRRGGRGRGRGYGYGYNYGYPYYYPSYNYPYYYPSYYYPSYYPSYGYYYSSEDQGTRHESRTPVNRAKAPVACFAMDDHGTYFGHVDAASSVTHSQELANQECSAGNSHCARDLGCALVGQSQR